MCLDYVSRIPSLVALVVEELDERKTRIYQCVVEQHWQPMAVWLGKAETKS